MENGHKNDVVMNLVIVKKQHGIYQIVCRLDMPACIPHHTVQHISALVLPIRCMPDEIRWCNAHTRQTSTDDSP